jgi:hypothetical protein
MLSQRGIGDGNDTLSTDNDPQSNDVLIGGLGDDTFSNVGADSSDTVDAGEGNDVVELRQSNADEESVIALGAGDDELNVVAYSRGPNAQITLGPGQDTIFIQALDSTSTNLTISDFETGSNGDVVDLSGYFQNSLTEYLEGWDGATNPFGPAGYMTLTQDGADAVFQIDEDGGGDNYADVIRFVNTNADEFTASKWDSAERPIASTNSKTG